MSVLDPIVVTVSPDNPELVRASYHGHTWDSTVIAEAVGYLILTHYASMLDVSEEARTLDGSRMRPDGPAAGN